MATPRVLSWFFTNPFGINSRGKNTDFTDLAEPNEDMFENLLVTAAYSADPTKISHVSFREQMKLNGYDDVVLNNFASSLKSHPQAPDWRLQNYKIMGYCKRSPTRLSTSKLAINFPSFKQLEVEF